MNALEYMMKKDWVRFPRIGAPKQDDVSIFSFAIRAGASARPEYRRQTGDAGRVSSSVAAIDIVRPYHGPDELLRRIVQLVGGLGAAEHSEIARIILGNRLFEGRGNAIQSFVPRGRTMPAVFADQRLRQTAFECNRHKPSIENRSTLDWSPQGG